MNRNSETNAQLRARITAGIALAKEYGLGNAQPIDLQRGFAAQGVTITSSQAHEIFVGRQVLGSPATPARRSRTVAASVAADAG